MVTKVSDSAKSNTDVLSLIIGMSVAIVVFLIIAAIVIWHEVAVGSEVQDRAVLAFLFIPMIFVMSILVGVIQFTPSPRWLAIKWYILVTLAITFTGVMLVAISLGLGMVNTPDSSNHVRSLGFVNFYQGTFVKDVEPEWLSSLTVPTRSPSEKHGWRALGGMMGPVQ